MDAGRFYALLRFEEASLALRAAMRMNLVDRMGERVFSRDELRHELGFTEQAARTFFALLQVMDVLDLDDGSYRVTARAAQCLADGRASSRKPYLSMGAADDAAALIELLQGGRPADALPLYGGENAGQTVMDDTSAAREIAMGLSSRARNFADPLAAAVASAVSSEAPSAKSLADIGAGSPYVAIACLRAIPSLERATLFDRANGMRFAREMAEGQPRAGQIEFLEGDFFDGVPTADVYILSNTAHDWRPAEYSVIANNVRAACPEDGMICIHEPMLLSSWINDGEWVQALWMACYAQTLFRLTLGEGTCYTPEEHHSILEASGFAPIGEPIPTCDGCAAMFYRPAC